MSDDMIDKINSILTATTGTVVLDKVLQDPNTAVTFSANTNAANQSTAEKIKTAKDAVTGVLATEQAAATAASQAVESNNAGIENTVDAIMKMANASKDADGNTFLKAGVTKDDLTKAITAYKDALVSDGNLATGGAKAGGTSDAITAAKNAMDNLFSTSTTIKTGAKIDADTVYTVDYKDKTNTAAGAEGKIAADIAVDTAMNTVSTELKTGLDTYVKAIAGVEINSNISSARVDQIKDVLNTLNNTELTTAIVDYNKAVSDKAGLGTNASDAQKAEAQAKVDTAKANLDKLNTEKSPISVTDLFGGSDASNFTIASKVDDNNNLTINIKNKSGDDTVITIANANQLKSGDTLTITSQAMVETEQAKAGKDALRLQIGANSGQEMYLGINSMKASDLSIVQTKEGKEGDALEVTNQASAAMAINAYDMAIQKVSTERAKMGAVQNRLEHTIQNLDTASENTQTAESRIRDTDMAEEMVNYSSSNILSQAGQSMLAQAKNSTQGILSLLQ